MQPRAYPAATGACLKALVSPEGLLLANSRFESSTRTVISLGQSAYEPAIPMFGRVTTVVVSAGQIKQLAPEWLRLRWPRRLRQWI